MLKALTWLLLFTISTDLFADVVHKGDYTIHYTVFPSTVIPPEVASLHGITRSDNRIIVNISVRKTGTPVTAGLTGSVTNLLEQEMALGFAEVVEQDAIYYLASHISLADDILRFSINVRLAGETDVPLNFIRRYD